MSASGTRTGHWEVLHVGGGGLGVQPGQGLCTRGEPGEARHQCGELTLRDSRREHQAWGWDRARTKT